MSKVKTPTARQISRVHSLIHTLQAALSRAPHISRQELEDTIEDTLCAYMRIAPDVLDQISSKRLKSVRQTSVAWLSYRKKQEKAHLDGSEIKQKTRKIQSTSGYERG